MIGKLPNMTECLHNLLCEKQSDGTGILQQEGNDL